MKREIILDEAEWHQFVKIRIKVCPFYLDHFIPQRHQSAAQEDKNCDDNRIFSFHFIALRDGHGHEIASGNLRVFLIKFRPQ